MFKSPLSSLLPVS